MSVLGGRIDFIGCTLLVFWVKRAGVLGLEDTGSWILESADQGSVVCKGRFNCFVTNGCIGR